MAASAFKKFEEITSADTDAFECELDPTQKPYKIPCEVLIYVDKDNSGTIQFQVSPKGVAPSSWAGIKAWPANSKEIVTVEWGVYNLWAKASAASQKFTPQI